MQSIFIKEVKNLIRIVSINRQHIPTLEATFKSDPVEALKIAREKMRNLNEFMRSLGKISVNIVAWLL